MIVILLQYTNKNNIKNLTDKEFNGMMEGFWYKVGDILTMTQPGETSQYVLDNIAFAGVGKKEQTKYENDTNVIRSIRENGNNEFPTVQIIDKFKGTNKSIQFAENDIDEYLLKPKYGKSETLSTFMLLYPSLDFSNKFP